MNKNLIKSKLLEYGHSQSFTKTIEFTSNKEANDLLIRNKFAFLIAVVLDQGKRVEDVWEIPFRMKRNLGHFNPVEISKLSIEQIENTFDKKPRYPKKMAKWIKYASELVISKYDGETENIWNDNPRTDDLHRRFEEFKGIGQKKASMATNSLVRDLGVQVKDKKWIDVSYDIHVRRVFLRSGLVEKDTQNLIIKTARLLNPDYPGELDLPSWLIGRQWCHPTNPDCDNCTITSVCPKIKT